MAVQSTSASDTRRNFLALWGDYFFFGVAMHFLSQTTVLPSLVRHLTDSAPLIGLVSTIQTGGWLLPQLIAANYVADKPLKKRYVAIPALAGRLLYPFLAWAIWAWAEPHPRLTLALFYLAYSLFVLADGLASVPWFDVFSKSLPPRLRGRLVGWAQMTMGIAGIGAGLAVGRILGAEGPGYPANYALLYLIASVSLGLSLLSFLQVRERPSQEVAARMPWAHFLPQLARVLREDRSFRALIITRLLVGWSGMAMPFYVVYALDVLGFQPGVIGTFVSAQVVGGILSGAAMGYIGEHKGTRAVIRFAAVFALASPLTALALAFVREALPVGWLIYAYSLIFAALGALANANMAGFMNYILEIAPEAERPLYVGLANTLSSLVLLAPLVGGLILEAASFHGLMLATAAVTAMGFILSLGLGEPRERAARVAELSGA